MFHDRDQLACLREKDGALLLERMYFADEIRDGDGILPDRKRSVDKRELKLAVDLIERMKGTFDHSAYHDRYRDRLMAIIDEEAQGRDDHRAQGRGAEGAVGSDGGARGEPLRRGRAQQARRSPPRASRRKPAAKARDRARRPAKKRTAKSDS